MNARTEVAIEMTPQIEGWRIELADSPIAQNAYSRLDAAIESVRYTRLYGLSAVEVETDQTFCAKRTRRDSLRDGMNDYKILFQLSGRATLVQDDYSTELAAGDLGLLDVTRPATIHPCPGAEPGRWLGLHFPRQHLVSHLGFEPQGGQCWRHNKLPARLLVHFISDAMEEEESGSLCTSQTYLQQALYNLVGALFGADDLPRHFSQGDKLFLRICSIIKRHFADADIGPTQVAAEAGISIRYLQKIFAMRGTTYGHFIKSFRLNHAADMLNDRGKMTSKLPLVDVARACGYRDYAHFARNFRARFGHTPGSFSRDGAT